MLRIPHACDRLGGIRHLLDSGLEEFFGRLEKFRPFAERTLTEQRSTNLKHQLDVVRVPEFECSTEAAKRGVILPSLSSVSPSPASPSSCSGSSTSACSNERRAHANSSRASCAYPTPTCNSTEFG